jgi:hypothetical protein
MKTKYTFSYVLFLICSIGAILTYLISFIRATKSGEDSWFLQSIINEEFFIVIFPLSVIALLVYYIKRKSFEPKKFHENLIGFSWLVVGINLLMLLSLVVLALGLSGKL